MPFQNTHHACMVVVIVVVIWRDKDFITSFSSLLYSQPCKHTNDYPGAANLSALESSNSWKLLHRIYIIRIAIFVE